MVSEEWRDFDGFIEVSNHGNIRKPSKINADEYAYNFTTIDRYGYKRFTSLRKSIYMHHAVAYLFIGERPKGLVIDHIDRNKQNNHISNLRYCTQRDNVINSSLYRTDLKLDDKALRRHLILYECYLRRKFGCVKLIEITNTYVIHSYETSPTSSSFIIKIFNEKNKIRTGFSTLYSATDYVKHLRESKK